MIGYISGKVVGKLTDRAIIKTPSGVGYTLSTPPQSNMMVNENVELFVLDVRNDNGVSLYGFHEIESLEWVEKLLKVSGVGPKSAANIIYTLGWQDTAKAINNNDYEELLKVKGLGKKGAKKIVLELKGELIDPDDNGELNLKDKDTKNIADSLSSFGYNSKQISTAITNMKNSNEWDPEDTVGMIRLGLKHLQS